MLRSKFRFKMEPAKQAEMKYKQKLMTMRGAVNTFPIPNTIAASFFDKDPQAPRKTGHKTEQTEKSTEMMNCRLVTTTS